ncbi:MAG: UbiD family decarboxylase [Pyrinomonadaceae bacterium]|nr:UbiD family decarboxylase [Pyrinomonadaceae bacterium]
MIETLEKTGELKTIKQEKDTWILEVPAEICQKEGFAEGTLVSLTIKNSGIQASFVKPSSKKLQKISKRLLKKNHKLYGELKRVGD